MEARRLARCAARCRLDGLHAGSGGFGAYWLGLFTLSILFATAGTYIGHRVARPLRSYLIALLVSAGLAILLRLVAPNPAAPIFWFALTAFGVFWAWYWERTEPLPKA